MKENMWLLKCPAPNCGELANGYYNAGVMLADERNGVTEEDSKMQIISNIVENDFDVYIAALKENGIKGYLENKLGDDKFFAFSYGGKYYHVSYVAKKGELLTHDSDQAVLTLLKTNDLIETDFRPIRIDSTMRELVDVVAQSKRNIFPVVDSKNHFQGYVSLEDIRSVMFKYESYDSLHVYNFMKSAPAYVYVNEKMDRVMAKFEQTEAWNLPVVTEDRTYVGFISKSKIFSSYREQLKQVSHD